MHGRLINQQNRSWNKTNKGSNTGKYNKSLKESRERGFTNVTRIPKITIVANNETKNQGYTVSK